MSINDTLHGLNLAAISAAIGVVCVKVVKFPPQYVGKLMMPRGPHQRLDLCPSLLTSRDRHIHMLGHNVSPCAFRMTVYAIGLQIWPLLGGGRPERVPSA